MASSPRKAGQPEGAMEVADQMKAPFLLYTLMLNSVIQHVKPQKDCLVSYVLCTHNI